VKRTSRLLRNRASLRLRIGVGATRAHSPPGPVRAPASAAASAPAPALIDPAAAPSPPQVLTLARAKGQWLIGDWQTLAQLDDATIEQHEARDRVALLAASAHLQLDAPERAATLLRRALAWGCDRQLAARLLISGVHNTLGRAAALRRDAPALERHFGQALNLTGDADAQPAAHTRAVREMTSLRLLPQAVDLLQQRAEAVAREAEQRPARAEAQLTMLRSEISLVQHELALALQREPGLLAQPAGSGTAGAVSGGEVLTPEALRVASKSQLGQDLWVLERSDHRRSGYFVEFGATDGVRLSNSWLLERLGWRGLCAEPNPRFFEQLRQNRSCIVTDACVGPHTGERVEFVLAQEFGGFRQDMSSDMHSATREAYWADASNRLVLETVSLDHLLRRHGAPRDIDYLSIDTEGSELAILRTFPLDQWNIRLITVEHNYTADREAIHTLLAAHGYRRTEAQWDDWYEKI
jgi:FkbM family methyltransferase